jgi:hypothetical protein
MNNDEISISDGSLDSLQFQSQLAASFLSRTFSGLTAMTYRELGERAVNELWFRVLTSHQGDRYEDGLRKLGIENEPAAVAAARYHYFTNIIGGLKMEYVEESSRKVWIRYLAPMWTYAGVALIAMPASVRRTVFGSWHPRNGRYMGNPRLGYVATKFSMDGDPYDEGYFYEYDHDLREDETYRIEVVRHTPRFDPEKAPTLDRKMWPEARILKARPKFSAGYVQATVDSLYQMVGELRTHQIVRSTMRMLAIQMGPQLVEQTGVSTNDVPGVLRFHKTLLAALGRDVSTGCSDGHGYLQLLGYKPFDERYPTELNQAFFEFHSMATRMMSGTIKVEREEQGTGERWTFVETGHWLY